MPYVRKATPPHILDLLFLTIEDGGFSVERAAAIVGISFATAYRAVRAVEVPLPGYPSVRKEGVSADWQIGAPEHKQCNRCSRWKHFQYFAQDKSRKDGLSYTCKRCRGWQNKKYKSSERWVANHIPKKDRDDD